MLNNYLNNAVTDEVSEEIKHVFKTNNDPFKEFDTQHKRLEIYKSLKLYVEPKILAIDTVTQNITDGNTLIYKQTEIPVLQINLKYALRKLLQFPGLFDAMQSYIKFLNEDKDC